MANTVVISEKKTSKFTIVSLHSTSQKTCPYLVGSNWPHHEVHSANQWNITVNQVNLFNSDVNHLIHHINNYRNRTDTHTDMSGSITLYSGSLYYSNTAWLRSGSGTHLLQHHASKLFCPFTGLPHRISSPCGLWPL